MTQSLTRSTTNALVACLAAVALLLAAPLAIAALETNSITGATMRAFESTAPGELVASFGADADAAVSHTTQLSKARGQASFFCFAWDCSGYVRTSYGWIGSKLKTTWHPTCTRYANMVIYVNSAGTVASGLIHCA